MNNLSFFFIGIIVQFQLFYLHEITFQLQLICIYHHPFHILDTKFKTFSKYLTGAHLASATMPLANLVVPWNLKPSEVSVCVCFGVYLVNYIFIIIGDVIACMMARFRCFNEAMLHCNCLLYYFLICVCYPLLLIVFGTRFLVRCFDCVYFACLFYFKIVVIICICFHLFLISTFNLWDSLLQHVLNI